MAEHPVRLVVDDDLQRSRLTVFFRLLLAIPHLIWFSLWGFFAVLMAIGNWFVTLLMGRSPAPLHEFLARFVKYATQLYAYLYLAANPYPAFLGQSGYPIDVQIAESQRQGRWGVAFRLLLALPALLLGAAVLGSLGYQQTRFGGNTSTYFYSRSLLVTAAILAWFACLVRARMPLGLRDLVTYGLGYSAQLWAYLFVLTDRYPNSDPQAMLTNLPARHDPIRLVVTDDRRRSRLTVFFRLLLALPHLVWLTLWGLLALLGAIGNWFATLVRGRSPAALNRFLCAFLRYQAHVYAYLYLIANPFPGFGGQIESFPVEATVDPPTQRNRWTVAFRLLLAIPALLITSAYGSLLAATAFLGWFASLVRGEMPPGLRNAAALALRYSIQTSGYLLLLTDAYPYSGPCREGSPAPAVDPVSQPPDADVSPPASPIVAFG